MKLIEYRKKENKTQQEIADDLNVSQGVYQKWETGETIPTKENMQKIFIYTNGEVTANDIYNVSEVEVWKIL